MMINPTLHKRELVPGEFTGKTGTRRLHGGSRVCTAVGPPRRSAQGESGAVELTRGAQRRRRPPHLPLGWAVRAGSLRNVAPPKPSPRQARPTLSRCTERSQLTAGTAMRAWRASLRVTDAVRLVPAPGRQTAAAKAGGPQRRHV